MPDGPGSAPNRRVGLSLVFTLGLSLTPLCRAAVAQETNVEFNFDIPAQALSTALDQYGNITGQDVLYDSALTVGRRSAAVQGRLSPDSALVILLETTSLYASHLTRNSFILLPVRPVTDGAASPPVVAYYGRIQAGLRAALCSGEQTQPGSYRLAMRFWIDSAGNVARFEQLGTTGAPDLDARIGRTLTRLNIGVPPPAELPQPVLVVVVPQAPGIRMGCDNPQIRSAGGRHD
jgi:hypothetical protein